MIAISLIFVTGAGLGWLDIVDHWTNIFNLILIGVVECIIAGWIFKPKKIVEEVNKNTKKYTMPSWWFIGSVKFLSPLVLAFFFAWNIIDLFKSEGGYGGYPMYAQIIGGWLISAIVVFSGLLIKLLTTKNKKLRALCEAAAKNEKTWDEMGKINDAANDDFSA